MELPCDARPLLHHRFACREVAFPFGELGASLPVAEHATDEEDDRERDHREQHRVAGASLRPVTRYEESRSEEAQAQREAARRRPDRERVQRTEVPNAGRDDLRISPEPELDRVQQRHHDSYEGREAATEGDRGRGYERDEGRNQAVVTAAEPHLCLREHR
jgi:hypothetical protein